MVFCNKSLFKTVFKLRLNHNPYFNRWFSAILDTNEYINNNKVTILILIDGFLQY